jgi:hypothetical protein
MAGHRSKLQFREQQVVGVEDRDRDSLADPFESAVHEVGSKSMEAMLPFASRATATDQPCGLLWGTMTLTTAGSTVTEGTGTVMLMMGTA